MMLIVLVIITIVINALDLDRSISSMFYTRKQGWFLEDRPLWDALYNYGTIPGIIVSIGALCIWLLSFYKSSLQTWRKPCLVMVLTAVLGAGILVNSVLKQYWGRPRPSQTIEYGGHWEYRTIFNPGLAGQGASFPCGHATMGFVLVAAGAFYSRKKSIAIAGVTSGIVLGGALSAARIVQGAHYFSDTIWAFGLITIVATGLTFYLPDVSQQAAARPAGKRQKLLITSAVIVAIAVMATAFMTRRPFFSTNSYWLQIKSIETIDIQTAIDPERIELFYADVPFSTLRVDAHGFGWMNTDYEEKLSQQQNGSELDLQLNIEAKSYFAELDHSLRITLPSSSKERIEVLLNGEPINPQDTQ